MESFLFLVTFRVTKNMLDNATTDEFFELVSCYAARDCSALNISDQTLEAFCGVTRQSPAIIKGAGWTMALLMFQIRAAGLLLEEQEISQRLVPLLNSATEGCRMMMDKFDRVLKQ